MQLGQVPQGSPSHRPSILGAAWCTRSGCSSPPRSSSGARNGRSKNGGFCSSLDFQIVG